MAREFEISENVFRLMVNQRGEFEHLSHDRSQWTWAYLAELEQTFASLQEVMGKIPPRRVLDIGSGVGAIDLLMARRWGSHVTLCDGEEGTGAARKHGEPFGSRVVTDEFLRSNNLPDHQWEYYNPSQLLSRTAILEPFDLVISLRSWCFHYEPESYLRFVSQHLHKGSQVVVDVRRTKASWYQTMCERWPQPIKLDNGIKHIRMLFSERGTS
jgi:2-polyprenyl-3-methyl-5-hydroxy-6-metoxy-1,4-benzoquinol methylase